MTDSKIKVRTATPADHQIVVGFNQAMAIETEDKKLDQATIESGVRLALGDPSRAVYYLAEIDGQVVGQTMITLEWSDWRNGFIWWIQSVYVDLEHRRCGVFRALHEHIRDLAKSKPDVCGLRLYVYDKNERAIETYRNLGMTVTRYLLCEETWTVDSQTA